MVAAGVCHYGDKTSNQVEQMNWSLEEVQSMAPISMIIHATTKFLEKKTERLIKAQRLSSDHQVLPIVIQEKAAQVRKDSEGWTCIMVYGSMADGLILEYYARKPTISDHWETITIKIPSYRDANFIPMLSCTCLCPHHTGYPCKHGILALQTTKNDRDLLQYRTQLNLASKHWYSHVYHVDSYVRQYDYEHTIHIPTISALDECELWPAAMHRQPG